MDQNEPGLENESSNAQVARNSVACVDALKCVTHLLQYIGEDPIREGLVDTPKRVVKSYNDIFKGYGEDAASILSTTFERNGYDEMVVLKDIDFFSTCEHHMLPFYGKAHVAYIPGKRVVGLSKLARLVDCYARRLQIQERLTEEIAKAIADHLQPLGVAVLIEAKHLCMLARGVQKKESLMKTSYLSGVLKDDAKARSEFMQLVST